MSGFRKVVGESLIVLGSREGGRRGIGDSGYRYSFGDWSFKEKERNGVVAKGGGLKLFKKMFVEITVCLQAYGKDPVER